MVTRNDLYTCKWLPEHILPRQYWEELRNHEMRFRLIGTHDNQTASGYMQIRIRWGSVDKWVFAGKLKLPQSSNILALTLQQGEQLRAQVLERLGPPREKRGYHPSVESPEDLQRIARKRRVKKTGSSDAGRAKAQRTLDAITARRQK